MFKVKRACKTYTKNDCRTAYQKALRGVAVRRRHKAAENYKGKYRDNAYRYGSRMRKSKGSGKKRCGERKSERCERESEHNADNRADYADYTALISISVRQERRYRTDVSDLGIYLHTFRQKGATQIISENKTYRNIKSRFNTRNRTECYTRYYSNYPNSDIVDLQRQCGTGDAELSVGAKNARTFRPLLIYVIKATHQHGIRQQ